MSYQYITGRPASFSIPLDVWTEWTSLWPTLLSLRDEVVVHSVAIINFSMRAVSWFEDIFLALYCQQLGLDYDRPLCVILHTYVVEDASKPHNHLDAFSVLPKRISDAKFAVLLDACADPLPCDTSTCDLTG
eukprot:5752997-Pleurochrysis_carterae.AAC.1